MGSIYEKLEQKGKLEVEEIINEAKNKAKMLQEKMMSEAKLDIQKIVDKDLIKNANLVKTKSTEIEQQAKQKILAKKKEMIDLAIKNVYHKIQNMSDNDFAKLTIKILSKETLKGNEVLKVAKHDLPKYIKLFTNGKLDNGVYHLDKINQQLKKGNLTLSNDTINIDGGFIIYGDNYDIDHSYQMMLNDLKNKYEAEIAHILFDEE